MSLEQELIEKFIEKAIPIFEDAIRDAVHQAVADEVDVAVSTFREKVDEVLKGHPLSGLLKHFLRK